MTYRIYITLDGRWAVRKDGAKRASKVFASKPEAVGHGAFMACKSACRMVVHRRDGTVESRHEFQ